MSFKCTPQIIGLVRDAPKEGQKHRATGKKIAGEIGKYKKDSYERYTQSITYDPTKSYLNRYEGFDNGYAAWDEIEHRASSYRTVGKTKKGEQYSRPLRHDAVVGFGAIFNPPEEECKDWTDEKYAKFYRDSWTVLCEVEPRVFSDKNVVMRAEHFDEGIPPFGERDRHQHIIGEAKDQNGKYCGNYIDARFFSRLNQIYPQRMRELGWDMEDLDVTNWKKFNNTPDENGVRPYSEEEVKAYRAERKSLWKKTGLEVSKYVVNKAQEAKAQALYDMERAEKILSDVEQQKTDLEVEKMTVTKKNDDLISETEDTVNSILEKANRVTENAKANAEMIRREALSDADEIRRSAREKAIEEARTAAEKEVKEELQGRKNEIALSLLQVENALAASCGEPDPDLVSFMNNVKGRTRDGQLVSLMEAYSDPYRKYCEQREANRKKVDALVRKGKEVMQKAGESIEDIGYWGNTRRV